MLGQELLPAHAHTIGSYLLVGHVITLRGCLQLEGHWEKNAPPPHSHQDIMYGVPDNCWFQPQSQSQIMM